MINVNYSGLYEPSQDLMKQRTVICDSITSISKAIALLSEYTDFDDQLRQLDLLRKHFEDEAYLIFCLGRALCLCADEFKKAEENVVALSEETVTANTTPVQTMQITGNPEFIRII